MVKEVGPERVARALRKMAEDLVSERRRVVALERENRELRGQLEELQRLIGERSRRPERASDGCCVRAGARCVVPGRITGGHREWRRFWRRPVGS